MDTTAIKERLSNIFSNRLGMDIDDKSFSKWTEPLLGKEINLNPRDLLYLYIDIEEEFNISIPTEDVACGNFSSLNSIVNIIYEQLEYKK